MIIQQPLIDARALRRAAAQRKSEGRPVAAIELLRRCCETEDSPRSHLELAAELRALGCYEQAKAIHYQQIAAGQELPRTWMELALCQLALHENEGALDSLYHLLDEESDRDLAISASSMLDSLEPDPEVHHPDRLNRLVQRAAAAFEKGDEELAGKRFRRAARITPHPARVWLAWSALLLQAERPSEALRMAVRAWAAEPRNPQPAIAAAFCLKLLDQSAQAVSLMRKIATRCLQPSTTQLYMNTLRLLRDQSLLNDWLTLQEQKSPYRIAVLHERATFLVLQGEKEKAAALWQLILRLDPSDRNAALQLQYMDEPDLGQSAVPRQAARQQLLALADALSSRTPPDELLRKASQTRSICSWCMASPDPVLHQTVLKAVSQEDTPVVRAWLHEQLTRPGLSDQAVTAVLDTMEALGDTGDHPILSCGRIASARIHTEEEAEPPLREKELLQGLWRNAADPRTPPRITAHVLFIAHHLWPKMNKSRRTAALYDESYGWFRALVITALRREDRLEEAAVYLNSQPYAKAVTRKYLRQPMFHEALTARILPND